MSYLTQTKIASDPHIILRISACAAAEGVTDPQFWVQERMLHFATRVGWGETYGASDAAEPGADEDAITDQMILASVQAIHAAEIDAATPPEPDPAE